MGCGFPTVCGVVAGLSASLPTQRNGNRWKPLVSLAGRASCSCFVRLCVSERRFVTSGPHGSLGTARSVTTIAPSRYAAAGLFITHPSNRQITAIRLPADSRISFSKPPKFDSREKLSAYETIKQIQAIQRIRATHRDRLIDNHNT